jgi:hypothetical protein
MTRCHSSLSCWARASMMCSWIRLPRPKSSWTWVRPLASHQQRIDRRWHGGPGSAWSEATETGSTPSRARQAFVEISYCARAGWCKRSSQAQSRLSYMGLPPIPILAAEDRPALAVLSSPAAADDCVIVADGDRTLGVLHGTDCNLSIYARNQMGRPNCSMATALVALLEACSAFWTSTI